MPFSLYERAYYMMKTLENSDEEVPVFKPFNYFYVSLRTLVSETKIFFLLKTF
jgi:hypothetical protein